MHRRTVSSFAAVLLFLAYAEFAVPVAGQANPIQKPEQDDVVRVTTELVQTDVMVFDRKGRFVDQLKPDQFQLVVDHKPQPIAFFEQITSGNHQKERRQSADKQTAGSKFAATRRGRIVLFFVDDLHLAPDSLMRARKALLEFINTGVAEDDQVAITSSSGQVGFLQQFTDDKLVLQSAVARLGYRSNTKVDMDSPPMSEFIAQKIRDGDESAVSYYVQEMMKQNCYKLGGQLICMMDTHAARNLVLERARQITTLSAPATTNTLLMLEGLMRTSAQLPGRKLLFLISDGFYLNDRQTASTDKIKRITDAAGKAGVVIYTLDARGIVSEGIDATNNRPTDSEGLTAAATIGEVSASQDGLNALARDTGGLALRNTNRPMSEWMDQVVDETSNYYLLAWRPDSEEQKRRKFNHLQVSIKDRPDLTVRLRRGYFKTTPLPMLTTKNKSEKDPTKAREEDMRLVIDAPIAQREIPTELTLDFLQVPGLGNKLMASLHIGRDALSFDASDDKQSADVDIGGIFYDDKGKPKSSFVGRLRISAGSNNGGEPKGKAVYNFQAWLPPGLYQVRVGVRDVRSGRIGSAMQWIKIPSLN